MKFKEGEIIECDPISFFDVFGVNPLGYILPIDPVFSDEEKVLHYRQGKGDYYQNE
jgi:hypothetical protein